MCEHHSHQGISCACHSPLQKIMEKEINKRSLTVTTKITRRRPPKSPESMIYYHPTEDCIITMQDGVAGKGGSKAKAIAIDQGCIVAVGSLDQAVAALPHVVPTRLDDGQTLAPGLIEPHMHLFMTAYMTNWDLDLGPYDGQYLKPIYNLNTIASTLKSQLNQKLDILNNSSEKENYKTLLEDLRSGKSITLTGELETLVKEISLSGYNIDPTLMTSEFEDIDKALLDSLAKDCPDYAYLPIVLVNASMHIAYVNSTALLLSFDNMGDLQKEHFSEYATAEAFAKGSNGVLNEMIEMQAVMPVLPEMTPESINSGYDVVFDDALAKGITLMLDAGTPDEGVEGKGLKQHLANYMATTNRTTRMALALLTDCTEGQVGGYPFRSEWKKTTPAENPMLFTPAIKIISDGSNQGRTGYQSEPYKGSDPATPDEDTLNCGLYNFTPINAPAYPLGVVPKSYNQLITDVAKSDQHWPILVHANGDRAIDFAIQGFQRLQTQGYDVTNRRHRIEHCSLLTDSSLQHMSNLGLSPSFLIGHVGYWGWAFQQQILGEARANLLDRCATSESAGMVVTMHSDTSVSPLGPLRYMEQAITRRMERAPQDGSQTLNEKESLTAEQALKAITYNAAWQCHAEQQVGTLEVGKWADFVILKENPLTWNERHGSFVGLRDLDIQETWIGGVRVYSSEPDVTVEIEKTVRVTDRQLTEA